MHGESDARIAPQIVHFMKISRSGYRQKVEDLSVEEIREIPELFARAAERARKAGFDAVELHFAHAYTLSSFLSRHNQRKDEYGGSLKNRLRLAEEVVEAARKAVGENFVLGARINGDESLMRVLLKACWKTGRRILWRLPGLPCAIRSGPGRP